MKFELKTTAQVERVYEVEADDEDQARKRLRTHFNDPGMLRDGLVTAQEGVTDKTSQRIIAINGKAVEEKVRAPRKRPGQSTIDAPPAEGDAA